MIGSSFIFKENHVLIEEDNPSDKVVIVGEELDGIDVDGFGSLVDLPRHLGKCSSMKKMGI